MPPWSPSNCRRTASPFHTSKDQAIFDGDEVLTQAGKPFSVFHPLQECLAEAPDRADYAAWPWRGSWRHRLSGGPRAGQIGFRTDRPGRTGHPPGMSGARALWDDFSGGRIERYASRRDFPAIKGVSYLSVHLRFGTISIRELVRHALAESRPMPGSTS
jgi:deoxyribodipyrimidine photo-lyase